MERNMEAINKSSMQRGSRISECNDGRGDGDNDMRGGKKFGDDILLIVIQLEINCVNLIKLRVIFEFIGFGKGELNQFPREKWKCELYQFPSGKWKFEFLEFN